MTEAERNAIEGRPLLLYDGVCALCNGLVQFLMKRDKRDRFRFAPLQSDLGREVLARFGTPPASDGVVLVTDALMPAEHLYHRSDAVAATMEQLSAPWRVAAKALSLVPRTVREWGYGLVARFRYRLFGRYATCPVPSPDQRRRLLGVYE